jgi:hypothetical protein
MANKTYLSKFIGLLLIMLMALTACGGNDEQPVGTPKPTATTMKVFEYVESTVPAVFQQNADSTEEATSEESEDAIELDPKLVGRGLGSYEKLECGTCHGTTGEGTDDGGAINNLTMAQEEFVTFMRSGGDIGSSHQYSTDRLSKNGTTNLYQYLLSLAQGE